MEGFPAGIKPGPQHLLHFIHGILAFERLYLYKRRLLKSNLEATTSATTLLQQRFRMFKTALDDVEKEFVEQETNDSEQQLQEFNIGQIVMLSETSFGEQIW